MSLPVVLGAALALIKAEEHCYLHAYPDPLSALGKALGHARIARIGSGAPIPSRFADLKGDPWTIGWGATGPGIEYGVVWTQEQCDAVLIERTQLAHSQARRMYPGLDLLHTNAQAAIISLVYNRGPSLKATDKRSEMRQLVPVIQAGDYGRIAELLRKMKRHWPGTGLVARREREAVLVERQ